MYKSEVYGQGGMYAKVVEDSISPDSIRLTTMELRYPRFIHSEFMTHRLFSRNASSSRAIPVAKMLEQVREDPAMPIHWGKNQPGMQASEELEDNDGEALWKFSADNAWETATSMEAVGLHKQVTNRILEPFQFITVVVTATEWENFYNLRLHKDAQPEIHELARIMKEAQESSVPKNLLAGEYHLPYVSMQYPDTGQTSMNNESLEECIKMSVARCARVSYLNHDKSTPDIEKDIALHDMLLEAGHMSPFEHVASPMNKPNGDDMDSEYYEKGMTHKDFSGVHWSGNFRGWSQYRQTL